MQDHRLIAILRYGIIPLAFGRLMDRKLFPLFVRAWQFRAFVVLPITFLFLASNLLAQTSPPLVQTFLTKRWVIIREFFRWKWATMESSTPSQWTLMRLLHLMGPTGLEWKCQLPVQQFKLERAGRYGCPRSMGSVTSSETILASSSTTGLRPSLMRLSFFLFGTVAKLQTAFGLPATNLFTTSMKRLTHPRQVQLLPEKTRRFKTGTDRYWRRTRPKSSWINFQ